ncbi:MAG: hypothetical protein BMS9Abin13_587 [Patescibacteria group bacterium]|nr:MAG: hypothetical protein BMS9Abin13_587 [Patescibacteria group bacterium]
MKLVEPGFYRGPTTAIWNGKPAYAIYWTDGYEYTRTGTAPGRVEVQESTPQHGLTCDYEWQDKLLPATREDIRKFIENRRIYVQESKDALVRRIESLDRSLSRWESRANKHIDAPEEETKP